MREKSGLFQKIYGCLLGGAIGNAMGSPLELMSYKEIEEKHGRVTTILDPSRLESEDDNAIGLLLCQAYIEKGGRVTSSDLAKIWLRDMDPVKYFWCLRNSYELLKQGVSPRLTGIYNIVTGSAIMAIAPVGLYNACGPDQAFIDAIDIGYMYQPKLDVDCACILASCIAEAMKPDSTVESIIDIAIEKAPAEPLATFDERSPNNIKDTLKKAIDVSSKFEDVFEVREELYKNCLQWHPIDPLEVLTLTLTIFQVSRGDAEMAMLGGTNIGRDSDTIANLNGALCGALKGIEAVPEKWVRLVSPKSVQRFKEVAASLSKLVQRKQEEMKNQVKMLDELI